MGVHDQIPLVTRLLRVLPSASHRLSRRSGPGAAYTSSAGNRSIGFVASRSTRNVDLAPSAASATGGDATPELMNTSVAEARTRASHPACGTAGARLNARCFIRRGDPAVDSPSTDDRQTLIQGVHLQPTPARRTCGLLLVWTRGPCLGHRRGRPRRAWCHRAFPSAPRLGWSAAEVTAWQTRPLEAFYPVIYLDPLVVKIRHGGHVSNRAAHIAIGVDMDGVERLFTAECGVSTTHRSVGWTCSPTSTGQAPATARPRRSMADLSTSAAPRSAFATSPTTPPDHYSSPARSDPGYTLICEKPS